MTIAGVKQIAFWVFLISALVSVCETKSVLDRCLRHSEGLQNYLYSWCLFEVDKQYSILVVSVGHIKNGLQRGLLNTVNSYFLKGIEDANVKLVRAKFCLTE